VARRSNGLHTAGFEVIRNTADLENCKLNFPLFAKPIAEGTGKGITDRCRISSGEQLRCVCNDLLSKYKQPVLVEEFLPGREFTTAILGTGSNARVLGTMEVEIIDKSNGSIYSYENKELCDKFCKYHRPTDQVARAVERLALDSHRVLGCRDASRVDIRCDNAGAPCFMEINPLAGLHPSHSDLPMIATQEGMSYKELLDSIIKSAMTRSGKANEA
jgi:D-alanine-D-alanine ligase